MNLFLIRISKVVIIPIIIFVFILIYWDPFKVFFLYRDYYTNNSITCNREDICFKLLNKRDNNISNFIVGSSRSQAFKTVFWSKKINQNPKNCFHYDGSGMGIYRATKAIQYIDKKTNKIDNLLLIIDTDFFMENSNKNGQFIPEGHLYIQHPAVSGESKLSYYWTFLKASFDPQFIFFNLLNRATGKYCDFMGNHILKSKDYNSK